MLGKKYYKDIKNNKYLDNSCALDIHIDNLNESDKGGNEQSHESYAQAIGNVNTISIDHHIYSDLSKTWEKRKSKAQPFSKITCTINPSEYAPFDIKLNSPSCSAELLVMADTGCQSCLAGIYSLIRLGISTENRIPVTMAMHAANNDNIPILGAAILSFSGKARSGKTLSTRQLVYITDSSDNIFLSREACTDLGMISTKFPTIGEATVSEQSFQSLINDMPPPKPCIPGIPLALHDANPCGCPPRQKVPPKPTSLPFDPTEDNREKLQDWLVNYYRSSAFNMCKTQSLTLMDSPPMRLMIDPEAQPTVHHTPLSVPTHWIEVVKAGLDQDVALGVVEAVKIGEPVT